MEKCLFAEVQALDQGEGCYASNGYFAQLFSSSDKSISNQLCKLTERGYIKTIKFNGRKRWIRATTPEEKTEIRISAANGVQKRKTYKYQIPPTGGSRLHPPVDAASTPEWMLPPPTGGIEIIEERKEENIVEKNGAAKADAKVFRQLWIEAFQKHRKCQYLHGGAKDAVAALKLVGESGLTPQQLINLAISAWERADIKGDGYTLCKFAVSIAGFSSKFNEIRSELSNGKINGITQGVPLRNEEIPLVEIYE